MRRINSILKFLLIVTIIATIQITALMSYVVFADENTVNNTTENITTEENTVNNTTTNTTPVAPVVVEKKQISKLKFVANLSTYSYTGGVRNPVVYLYDGNKKLTRNKEYTVTYKNNVKPGRASLVVQGLGDYTGTITKYYYIAPAKAKIKSVKFQSDYTKAKIKWQKDNNASGYIIYMSTSKNGKYKKIKTIKNKKTTTYTKKGLNQSKEYYFKIRAYKLYNKTKIMKKYSSPKTGGKLLAKVTLTASGSGAGRKFNLKKACDMIRGTVIKPGETFNWFRNVGPASGARGFKMASIFKNGKVAKGYGGGVCQVSSTIYQASKKAKLKIVERHIHSRPVTYTKLGNDATVSYGVQNLIVKNNKDYAIKLVTAAEGESTTCRIYSLAD